MTTALEKRIRRRVVGRDHDFFVVTAPGLAKLCRRELMSLPLSRHELAMDKAGIAFAARLHDAYLANLELRTAARVLMRMATFKADGYGRLKQRLSEVDWELFIPPESMRRFRFTAHQSRLHHSEEVTRLVAAAIDRKVPPLGASAAGAQPPAEQTVLIRTARDRFTLSLDSSGLNLHKRGIKRHAARAPLRETLAAAILLMAGYGADTPLLDPMCGSGTFALEAAMISQSISPGRHRSFAFMQWPSYQPGRWRHLLREADNRRTLLPAADIFASDIDPAACSALNQTVSAHDWAAGIGVSRNDFFTLNPRSICRRKGLVVLNPPYGRRLDAIPAALARYREILGKLKSDFKGWRLALLVPTPFARQLPIGGLNTRRLLHGGLDLTVVIGPLG
jgi:putative N6-adenine-specific DNA methylase